MNKITKKVKEMLGNKKDSEKQEPFKHLPEIRTCEYRCFQAEIANIICQGNYFYSIKNIIARISLNLCRIGIREEEYRLYVIYPKDFYDEEDNPKKWKEFFELTITYSLNNVFPEHTVEFVEAE